MIKYYDISLDFQFASLPKLFWTPWLGEHYLSATNKLLYIGESNYVWKQEENDIPPIEYLKDKNWTRNFVNQRGLHFLHKDGIENARILRNTERTIYNSSYPSNQEKLDLWSKSAYYVFVQRYLNSIHQEDRPVENDFEIGWQNFFDLLPVLKPNYCVFLGAAAVNKLYLLHSEAEKRGFEKPTINYHGKINNMHAKTFLLKKGKIEIKCVVLRHPSRYYSWAKWHTFVSQNMP